MTGTMRRAEWPDGPWDTEPDRLEWSRAGLDCLARRNNYGAWCGYVRVPTDHPWHGRHYDDAALGGVEVHGGLTWSAEIRGRDGWWIGFDCAHAYDMVPGLGALLGPRPEGYSEYRDVFYVRGEVNSLAWQVAAAGPAWRVAAGEGGDA